MEGVIFCCPPAWRKLLPPGVLGAERAEALAEQYWPLLVLTRRGCGGVQRQNFGFVIEKVVQH